MKLVEEFKNKVLSGGALSADEAVELVQTDLDSLAEAADEIRRHFCGDAFDLCTIVNGKSGRCPENCAYCAQSAHHHAVVEEYDLLAPETVLVSALSNWQAGVRRFSIVTSGRALTDAEIDRVCDCYRLIASSCPIELCASHGLLTAGQFQKLKAAGVCRYHNNLETSRNFFPQICTTHTYDDKLTAIAAARQAGLSVCSGGIIGLGETFSDRIDLALTLRELDIRSVPLNVLSPIPGTPLAGNLPLGRAEVTRTAAIFRFLLPHAQIRLAGGRALLGDRGESAIKAGINAAISGDMLTTAGITTAEDIALVRRLGFSAARPGEKIL